MSTFDDDNELPLFDEPPTRMPRERTRRPGRSAPRGSGPASGSNSVLRLAGAVALGILIVFGLVLWISSCSGQSTQGYTSYIEAMQPLARQSANIGKEFGNALGTPGLTMQKFQADLARWSQQEQENYIAAQRLQPPGPLQSIHEAALETFQLRYDGLVRLASTLAVAQQAHARGGVVAAALAGDAQSFSASDTMWERLYRLPAKDVLKAQNVSGVIVPSSRIVVNPAIVSAPQLATFYQRLGSPSTGQGTGAGNHGSTLLGANAINNGQSLALSQHLTLTVKCCGPSLVIEVLFKNSGAYPEVKIPVTMTVKAGTKSLYTQTKTVAQVAAGAQATVSFKDLQLPPEAYSRSNTAISVKVGRVPREVNLTDNAATYPVSFQIAAP